MHGGGTVRLGSVGPLPLQALPTAGGNRVIILTKPCILLKPATVTQQVQALQPKLPNNNNNNNNSVNNNNKVSTDSKPELLRCKRRTDLSSRLGLPKALPASVARRNARERNRVKQVNLGFDTLRDHVPNGRKNKKLSKVDTLRSAVEYIKYLMGVLTEDGLPMPSLPAQAVTFAPGELPDVPSPRDDQGFSDGEGALLTDSDMAGGEDAGVFDPPCPDDPAPFSKDEDVKKEAMDVENRQPASETGPPLAEPHPHPFPTAEEVGPLGRGDPCPGGDSAFQEYNGAPVKTTASAVADLAALDLAQMVSIGLPALMAAPPDSVLSPGGLTPLQSSCPHPHPHPHQPLGPRPQPLASRQSLSDAETSSSILSPASSVAASDHSSEALSSLGEEDIWDISSWLSDLYSESSAFTTGKDFFPSIPAETL